MTPFDYNRRQLRIAFLALCIIIPVGVIGYILIEKLSFWDALWITIVTLSTIGYGDVVPHSNIGRLFTVGLIIFGLGAVGVGAQAFIEVLVSPNIRMIRQRRRAEKRIQAMRRHFIICGEGEVVSHIFESLKRNAELRRLNQQKAFLNTLENRIERLFGRRGLKLFSKIRHDVVLVLMKFSGVHRNTTTILDIMVMVTPDADYAMRLSMNGAMVIEGDPSDDSVLKRANIAHARACMVMLNSDTDTLLSVLTARSANDHVYITAAPKSIELGLKITRMGANNVLTRFDISGQFLNNATLRPAVNSFFNQLLFEPSPDALVVQLYLGEESPWIGRSWCDLQVQEDLGVSVLAVRDDTGIYHITPDDDYQFNANDIVLAVVAGMDIADLQADCGVKVYSEIPDLSHWQRIPTPPAPIIGARRYTHEEAIVESDKMRQHYIICGNGAVIRSSLAHLHPDRPFVVISDEMELVTELRQQGFKVIYGNPTHELTLKNAGIDKALAILITLEDRAVNLLTVLTARTLNKNLFIVTAGDESVRMQLQKAGADRIVNPFRIAAEAILLATMRPVVSDFLNHILFNYQTGIETTELYIQEDSNWIGRSIAELALDTHYNAWVVGVRLLNGKFIFAPNRNYVIHLHEVLIVITPMQYADLLRELAHGQADKRPRTLRFQTLPV
ncbi:MAG: NAD-binding protein [bacterium]|nr:NAD-binding protein [bacterium]